MDLSEKLSFKADLNPETGEVKFNGLRPAQVLERRLADMRPVFAEQVKINGNPVVHRIYRFIGDTPQIAESGLKFDLTVVMPHPFGIEYPKTTGHTHLPLKDALGIPSPDLYQPITGKGIVLVQTESPDGTVRAHYIDAEEMRHILLDPWMGHLTINTGEMPMVFANICVRSEHTDYRPYINRRGASYYAVNKNGSVRFVPNSRYHSASLGTLRPNGIPMLEGRQSHPLYRLLAEQTSTLGFLTRPDIYAPIFPKAFKDPITNF